MSRLKPLSLLSIFFLILTVLYGNCAQNENSVTTDRLSGRGLLCDVNSQQKAMLASSVSEEDLTYFLTPSDGDWTQIASDGRRLEQTYLDVLAADQAHQLVYPEVQASFEPIIVAVIDSGVDHNHPDLANQILRRNGQMVARDFVFNRNTTVDESGHGTHVAGLIAAEGHNGEGIRGGAPEHVKILPIDVFGPTGGPNGEMIAQAIDYAVDNGADIINMSLGLTQLVSNQSVAASFEIVKTALQNAVARGVVVVVAAGNDNLALDDVVTTYPARFGSEIDGVITVGAYDATALTISPFSNFSPVYVEVQAPGSMNSGQGLISTVPGGQYDFKAGTSMASPLVAGLVALAEIYLRNKGIDLTPAQLEDLVKESSIQYNTLRALAQEGRVVNYRALIERLRQIYESGIIQHPRSLELNPGQTGRLAVRMNKFSSGLVFQWYKNGEMIEGANEIELMIRDFGVTDIGSYHLVVTLESGERVQSLAASVTQYKDSNCL